MAFYSPGHRQRCAKPTVITPNIQPIASPKISPSIIYASFASLMPVNRLAVALSSASSSAVNWRGWAWPVSWYLSVSIPRWRQSISNALFLSTLLLALSKASGIVENDDLCVRGQGSLGN